MNQPRPSEPSIARAATEREVDAQTALWEEIRRVNDRLFRHREDNRFGLRIEKALEAQR